MPSVISFHFLLSASFHCLTALAEKEKQITKSANTHVVDTLEVFWVI